MRQKIKKLSFYSVWLIKFSLLVTFYLLISLPLRFSKKYQNLWLLSERPDEARDNAYWLYKWILENQPDTNVRFVLSKDSVDYQKMPRKDLIIQPGSAKHYIYYILSSYSISTHMHGACPGKSFCIPFLPFMRKKKTVFLQHGIIHNMISLRGGLSAIIASSDQEKDLLKKVNPRYKNKVYTTGLCRYDQLQSSANRKRKLILVMPTFRKWLRDIARLKNADQDFYSTDYFKKWNAFLNSPELAKTLNDFNAELIFFPHREMQDLAKNFRIKDHRIKVGQTGEYDVQDLLKRADILVTDYSSVFFDFVYMDKPVLFYQFDQVEFFGKHYKSSGKPYPFGDIFMDATSAIAGVAQTIAKNCTIKKQYAKDAAKFFKFRDQKNCERNFELIRGLK